MMYMAYTIAFLILVHTTIYDLVDKPAYWNSLNQTKTAVFTLLLHILLPGDHITRMYSLSCLVEQMYTYMVMIR